METETGKVTLRMKIWKVASLLAIIACLWYLLIAPSLKLDDDVREKFHSQWNNLDKEQKKNAQALASFDLEKKVYPEIQDRLTKINDWFINKMIFAGGLLGAFLFQLWWPFWSQNISLQERERQVVAIFVNLLRSAPVCAVLGLACVVSLFMDIHIRRSLLLVHQLGVWAAEYGTVAFGGCHEQFPAWEQFIRMPAAGSTQQPSPCTQQSSPDMQKASAAQPPDPGAQASNSAQKPKSGMHGSLIDAVQTGNLSLMTLVLFAFYYRTFQNVCTLHGLDDFNRLTYGLVIAILLAFLLMTHQTSGNFVFTGYGHTFLFSSFWGYFAAWSGITILMVMWDFVGGWVQYRKNHPMTVTPRQSMLDAYAE
jgi:hypothetical protein